MKFADPFPEAVATWRAKRERIASIALSPPSRLKLSEWADQYRKLSAGLAEPGPWRTSRAPYMREPMDSITDPRVREVVIMKSARIGATQAVVCNTIGYYIHQEPSPIIVAFPTEQDAKKFSKLLLAPMIADTPVLAERVSDGARDASNTILQKSYPGGEAQMVGTTSPRNMRMVHGRIVCGSEIDAWEFSAGDDGDQIALLKKRADSYGAPKYIWESTPLVKGHSRIEAAFELSDQRRYHVPCPHCDHGQVLKWGGRDTDYGIKWKGGDHRTAYYLCENCHQPIEESRKFLSVAQGIWIPGAESEVRGYHLNALVSPFPGARWPVLVRQWLDCKHKPEQLRTFVNTVLGETWEDEGASVDPHALVSRLEAYPADTETGELLVPMGVGILTRSVDVQGDRLETLVLGIGAGQEAWPIDYEMIPGDPGTPEPWKRLSALIGKQYRHEGGAIMQPAVTFVDSGGHHTKEVYEFTRARVAQNVFAIKGASTEGAPVLSRPTRNNSAKAILYILGVFTLKESIMARLNKVKEPGPGYIHIPDWIDSEQLQQLTNEHLVTRIVGGRAKRVWVKTGRNEWLDLLAYALAAPGRLGPTAVYSIEEYVKDVQARGAAEKQRDPAPASTDQGVRVPAFAQPSRGGFVTGWKR